jgi:NTP pyrophosphatase (non-canonical NTP hydrolase)
VVTILVGLFLLVVEFMSVREKADAKTKKQQEQAAELLMKLVSREELGEFFKWVAEKNKESMKEETDQ